MGLSSDSGQIKKPMEPTIGIWVNPWRILLFYVALGRGKMAGIIAFYAVAIGQMGLEYEYL